MNLYIGIKYWNSPIEHLSSIRIICITMDENAFQYRKALNFIRIKEQRIKSTTTNYSQRSIARRMKLFFVNREIFRFVTKSLIFLRRVNKQSLVCSKFIRINILSIFECTDSVRAGTRLVFRVVLRVTENVQWSVINN